MLDIVASYHSMQFQGKNIIQTKENGEKLHSTSNQIQAVKFCFQKLSVTRYHGQLSSYKISEKTNDPASWEN